MQEINYLLLSRQLKPFSCCHCSLFLCKLVRGCAGEYSGITGGVLCTVPPVEGAAFVGTPTDGLVGSALAEVSFPLVCLLVCFPGCSVFGFVSPFLI